MALYFNQKYLTCPDCNNVDLTLEERMLVEELADYYSTTTYKVLKCCKCGNVVKKLNKFNEKPMMEV